MEFYSYIKSNWSKPVDEDSVLHHLATEGSTALCGTDKRHPDLYNFGSAPIQNLENSEQYICKKCYAIWKKKYKTG
jgi:hypothetical protein